MNARPHNTHKYRQKQYNNRWIIKDISTRNYIWRVTRVNSCANRGGRKTFLFRGGMVRVRSAITSRVQLRGTYHLYILRHSVRVIATKKNERPEYVSDNSPSSSSSSSSSDTGESGLLRRVRPRRFRWQQSLHLLHIGGQGARARGETGTRAGDTTTILLWRCSRDGGVYDAMRIGDYRVARAERANAAAVPTTTTVGEQRRGGWCGEPAQSVRRDVWCCDPVRLHWTTSAATSLSRRISPLLPPRR